MKQFSRSQTIIIGLTIFSMFFGAGNLIYPLKLGVKAGEKNFFAIIGFMLTGIVLPLLGLIAIILFNGDYKAFFYRLGKIPGSLFILFCMLAIGPLIAMPRIVALSYIMVAPFIGNISLPLFTLIFLGITFLGTYKENNILTILGCVISPLLLFSLLIIIIKGLLVHGEMSHTVFNNNINLFLQSIKVGYTTLDVLGALFFSSVVITILKENLPNNSPQSLKLLAAMGFKSGTIGVGLLAIIYLGISYIGVYHGNGLEHLNEGELFSVLSFRILGSWGAIIIAFAILMACYSTIIALSAVVAEYLQKIVLTDKISHIQSLLVVLSIAGIVANFGLSKILYFSTPCIEIVYPSLIMLMFCNIAYKLGTIKIVKIPVLLTLITSCIAYYF